MASEPPEDPGDAYSSLILGSKSCAVMDEEREKAVAHEYLCRLEEVRRWVNDILGHESLHSSSSATEFEAQLVNGISLAKLAHFFAPNVVDSKKIFDPDGSKYVSSGLHFRHTDNINHFLRATASIGLPAIFTPETTDVYDAKNLPRLVFCLHALSLFLFKMGIAPRLQELDESAATFSNQDLSKAQAALKEMDSPMPQFHHLHKEPILASPRNNAPSLDGYERISSSALHRYRLRIDKLPRATTRPQIQKVIDEVNVLIELEEVITQKKASALKKALEPWKLRVGFDVSKAEMYLEFLYHALLALDGEEELKRETIEAAMREANRRNSEHSYSESLHRLNKALRNDSVEESLSALKYLDIPLHSFAGDLYHEELRFIVVETGRDLSRDSLVSLITFLNNIALLNQAVCSRNLEETWKALNLRLSGIEDLDSDLKGDYLEALYCALDSKDGRLLTHFEIQDAIDVVNKSTSDQIIKALRQINDALKMRDSSLLYRNLLNPVLRLDTIEENDAPHTLNLLEAMVANKCILEEEKDAEAWLDNVFDAAHQTIAHAKEAGDVGAALFNVNMEVQEGGDHIILFDALNNPSLCLAEYLQLKHSQKYQESLLEKFKMMDSSGETVWVKHILSDGISTVYLNLQDHVYSWTRPSAFGNNSFFLGAQDIIDALDTINRSGGRMENYSTAIIVGLQARIRGYLTRQKLFSMLEHYYNNVESIIKVQACVRGHFGRKRFAAIVSRQSPVLKSLHHYLPHEESIVTIQRAWRKHKKALDLQVLMKVETEGKISLNVVRRYLYLLDHSLNDFEQELRLQSLKGNITKVIRSNQSLEKALDVMDVKIGLLVKNRISVEEVVAHSKTLVNHSKSSSSLNLLGNEEDLLNNNVRPGLKALRKESRARLTAYQHLFYYLQTNPQTLAKLIFAMPQLKTTKFIESVILSLYNFGANQREEYLLLKLFQTALEEEIRVKVEKPSDIITGQPLVIKIIVSFYRNGGKGSKSLRNMLGDIIRRILEDKSLSINTSPVDIYKQWINSEEFLSGRASEMPYNVTPQEALSHEEVRKRLNRSMVKLKQATTMFLATILRSRKKIPYGMLFMARVLYVALKKKFPQTQEKEILKVVGNFIYYRFINGAIVAPDAFDVINLSADNVLGNEQRRNLGSISKILQFAASKRGYGEESVHLMALNPYIVDCHEKFKKFFRTCVEEVPSPEEEFNMDQFSEATLIAKPVIFISLQEIVDTHQLLLDFQEDVAPHPTDPLHELLDDLGESEPCVSSLLGIPPDSRKGATSEIYLTLSNKFEALVGTDRSESEELFIKTKHLVISVLPCTKESNLIGCLKSLTSPEQEALYWDLLSQREEERKEATRNKSKLEHTKAANQPSPLSLGEAKRQILKNLLILEVGGLVSSKDGCRSLISSIMKDILNIRQYRSLRDREIFRLMQTLSSLKVKSTFLEEQVASYDAYLKTCLKNLQVRKVKRVHFQQPQCSSWSTSRMRSRGLLRYSASRLHEKGVLLSIDGLPPTQFKNVQFEIAPTEHDGVFQIQAKFMGVNLEVVEVDIQDLLQLQYEGVSCMNIFGKANINVNLLLHFLNSKFYGRKK